MKPVPQTPGGCSWNEILQRQQSYSYCTVSVIVVDAVRPSISPVTVTVKVPSVAVLLAVKVSSLLLSAGFELNFAVTPLGKPDTDKVTAFLNGAMMIVVVPVLPGATVSLFGEAISVRPGVTVSWIEVV
jgi:hypothetical protein